MIEDAEFEWDPAKAETNLRKHGIAFDYATRLFLDPDRLECWDETDHGEDRWIATGQVEEFVLFVVFTIRGRVIRIISARKATRHERIEYWHGQIPS